MEKIIVTFKLLRETLLSSNNCRDVQVLSSFFKETFDLDDEKVKVAIKTVQKSFLTKFFKSFEKHQRKKSRFLSETNKKILNCNLTINFEERNNVQHREQQLKNKRGRPIKKKQDEKSVGKRGHREISYGEGSERTKRRKAAEIRNKYPEDLLLHAVKPLMKEADSEKKYSPDEALALFVNAKLTRRSYQAIRKGPKSKGGKNKKSLYPSYDEVLAAKKRCYPAGIEITEHGASVPAKVS